MFGTSRWGGAGSDAGEPRGLASLMAALQHSQRSADFGAAGLGPPSSLGGSRLLHQHGFGGIGLAAASAAAAAEQGQSLLGKASSHHGGQPVEGGGGGKGGLFSHAISPAPTTYQPASPDTWVFGPVGGSCSCVWAYTLRRSAGLQE